MSLQNWSTSLFSLGDQTPTFLPARFRLTDGSTRNSNNCELTDILSAGYYGPVEEPPAPGDGNTVNWDPITKSWVVEKLSDIPGYEAQSTSAQVLAYLRSQLNCCDPDILSSEYTEKYRQAIFTYRGQVFSLIHECIHDGKLLTDADIPPIPDDSQSTYAKVAEYQNNLMQVNYERYKKMYENQGVIYADPAVDLSNLSIPSGWVIGLNPIEARTFLSSYLVPDNYELMPSGAAVVLVPSGYYESVPSGSSTLN